MITCTQPARAGKCAGGQCALVSQQGAIKLLNGWGVEHNPSNRYQQEWETAFEEFKAEQERERERMRKQFLPRLQRLETEFPQLAKFLSRNFGEIEVLGDPASDGQVNQLEQALEAQLPESYRRFLSCTSSLVYGEATSIGFIGRSMSSKDKTQCRRACVATKSLALEFRSRMMRASHWFGSRSSRPLAAK